MLLPGWLLPGWLLLRVGVDSDQRLYESQVLSRCEGAVHDPEGCGGSSNHGFTGSASASTLLSSYGRYARLAAMPCRSVAVDTPLPTTTCNKLLSCSGWGTATCNKLLSRLMSNLYIYEKSPRRAVWAGSRVMGRLASAVLTLGGVDAQPSSRHG